MWELGFPEQAERLAEEAVLRARRSGDPSTLQSTLFRTVWIHMWGGNIALAKGLCEEWLASQTEVSRTGTGPIGRTCDGWCDAVSGRIDEGLASMERGLSQWEAAGVRLLSGYSWSLYAPALGLAGRAGEGLQVIQWAIPNRIGEEACFAAEVHRHLGELFMALPRPDPDAAESAFRSSIDIAREQETKSWELLAGTSLPRLLQRQGRVEEARELLRAACAWLTEGLDWPDLVEARALLAELEASG